MAGMPGVSLRTENAESECLGLEVDFLLKNVFLLDNKNMEIGKKCIVRYRSQLPGEFASLVAQDARLKNLKLNSGAQPTTARFELDGQTHRFTLQFLLSPTIDDIPTAELDSSTHPLLVVPRLSPVFLDTCQQRHVSVADLNGQVYLRARNFLLSLPSLPGRDIRFEQEPRNIFGGKSARIVRSLLSDPKRTWRQADLVLRAGATSGLVSRIVTHLTQQGYLKKTDARRFHIVSPPALLDAWAQADDFARRTTTHRFTTLNADPLRLAKTISSALAKTKIQYAFTQWIAAWLRQPYTEPPVVSLYISHLPPQAILDQLGFQAVGDAGRVWFHVPSDEGVFRETRGVQDLPLAADAQIYLDLLETGLRGPEQAQALRDWPGFCLP